MSQLILVADEWGCSRFVCVGDGSGYCDGRGSRDIICWTRKTVLLHNLVTAVDLQLKYYYSNFIFVIIQWSY